MDPRRAQNRLDTVRSLARAERTQPEDRAILEMHLRHFKHMEYAGMMLCGTVNFALLNALSRWRTRYFLGEAAVVVSALVGWGLWRGYAVDRLWARSQPEVTKYMGLRGEGLKRAQLQAAEAATDYLY